MFSLRRALAVTRKELKHLLRDHRMRPVLFVIPVVQVILLGVAANLDVEDVRVVVLDRDRSPTSRTLTDRIDASPAFVVAGVTRDERAAELALDDRTAELVLVIPDGAQRGLARGEAVELPVWIDGTDTNRGLLAQGYLEELMRRESADRLPPALGALPFGVPDPRVRVLFNPALQSRWFMLPALVVMVLTVLTTILATMAVVKEREKGTIEQLSVTPIRPGELIVGKLLPFVGVGAFVATLVTLAAILVFGVPLRGSPFTLFGMGVIYVMSTLGFGLFVSTVSGTQQQAMMSALLILMPSFLLGGVFYPITNMPWWAQRLADLSPVRYFVVMARGVFLKGAGFATYPYEVGMMTLLGTALLGFAILRFSKRSS